MKKSLSMTKAEAWFLLITGLLMGTVFTFGVQFWNAPIAREEAICVRAAYSSCKAQRNNGHIKELIVRFEDHEQLYIDGTSASKSLLDCIRSITPGTELELLIHPNSNTILDFRMGKTVLLEFETVAEKLENERRGFHALGLVMYAFAACGGGSLLLHRKRV